MLNSEGDNIANWLDSGDPHLEAHMKPFIRVDGGARLRADPHGATLIEVRHDIPNCNFPIPPSRPPSMADRCGQGHTLCRESLCRCPAVRHRPCPTKRLGTAAGCRRQYGMYNKSHLPPGALAWRDYDITLPSGLLGSITFTLGDPDFDSFAARFAREHEASIFGSLTLEVPGEAERPIVWMVRHKQLQLWYPDTDYPDPSEEVRSAVVELYETFIHDIGDLVELDENDPTGRPSN